MNESDPSPGRSPSPIRSSGRGRQLVCWIVLGAALALFLFLAFLVALTTPNLRRVVAPPVISQSQSTIEAGTQSGLPSANAVSTSATQAQENLDDFPHLSPTLRNLARVWFERCAETDKAIETIPDLTLRRQAIVFLEGRREKMRDFLNFPLEWKSPPGPQTEEIWTRFRFYNRDAVDEEAWNNLLTQYPDFADVIEREQRRLHVARFRMFFELCAHNRRWDEAAEWCAGAERISRLDYPDLSEFREVSQWDEEVYCWRQMGPTGILALSARSYQRALDTRMQNHPTSPFYHRLRMAGDLVVWSVIMREKEEETKDAAEQQN